MNEREATVRPVMLPNCLSDLWSLTKSLWHVYSEIRRDISGEPGTDPNVARLIQPLIREGHQLVVVLSAMSRETDRLMKMAKTLSIDPMIGSWMCSFFWRTGHDCPDGDDPQKSWDQAQSFTGRQVGIVTDSTHTKA